MKKVKNVLAAALCLLGFSQVAVAQDNSLLWSVSGNGLEKPSYLYGTIHIICADDFKISDKVENAFGQCGQLYLELDMDNEKEMAKMIDAANGDKPLTEILSTEEQQRLDKKLQDELGINLAAVNNYSLSTVSMLFLMKHIACQPVSYEGAFIEMAQKAGVSIEGLEKVKFQMKCLENAFDQDEAFEQIFDPEGGAMLDQLIGYYKAEDINGMSEMFVDSTYMNERAHEWILQKRNYNWVNAMPKIMADMPTFFAVGAGHLLNEDGLIALLRAEGYTVTPVFE